MAVKIGYQSVINALEIRAVISMCDTKRNSVIKLIRKRAVKEDVVTGIEKACI